MRLPRIGDRVLHFQDSRLVGTSRVASRYREVTQGPPDPGPWAKRQSYYRVDLEGYAPFAQQPTIDEILSRRSGEIKADIEQNQPKRYLFVLSDGTLRPTQGKYLTRCSPVLYDILSGETTLPIGRVAERPQSPPVPTEPYDLAKALEALFIDREEFHRMLEALRRKKNLILAGAPGVGKTFVAQRLAYALLEAKDASRIELVEFHPSYSYEDFIRGWRPVAGGNLTVVDGAFLAFCGRAQTDPGRPYVFLIDEINRGDLAKIFGESLMLLEADKRSPEFAVRLAYGTDTSRNFWIPPNVHVLGMMNTADRSLALVDYALRRRFAFFRLVPAFARADFRAYLLEKRHLSPEFATKIIDRLTALNEFITGDSRRLGPGYEIGHSFFCQTKGEASNDDWYADIVDHEIGPLLETYWLDNPNLAKERIDDLLAP